MKRILFALLICTSSFANIGVVFLGNTGAGNQGQYDVAKGIYRYCQKNQCNWMSILGDQFMPAGVKHVDDPRWHLRIWRAYENLELSIFPVLGDQDYEGSIQAQIDYSRRNLNWKMPGRYYRFEQRNVEFFAIDTNWFNHQQRAWLKGALRRSTADWKVVYGHHPIISYGELGGDASLKDKLLPLLKEYDVDFYVSGHEFNSQLLTLAPNTLGVNSGVGSQKESHEYGDETLYADSELGFSVLEFDKKEAQVKFVDIKGEVQFEKAILLQKK